MAFSRDLKDFVAAFKAGWDMLPSQTDEDYKRAQTAYLKKKMANDNSDLERQKLQAEIESEKALANYRNNPNRGIRTYQGANSPEPLTAEQEAELTGIGGPGRSYVTPDPDIPQFRRGGAVPMPKYADGGFVDQAWLDRPAGAIPTATTAPTATVTQPSNTDADSDADNDTSPSGDTDQDALPAGFSYAAASDAVKSGYDTLMQQFKQTPGAIAAPADARGKEAMQKGIGAFDPGQLPALRESLGAPSNDESDRANMQILAQGWEKLMRWGKPKLAGEFAGRMIQTYRLLSNRYAAIAQQAAQEGDVDGAADALLRAYTYVPDGKSVQLKKTKDGQYAYQYTDDKTGKLIAKRLLSPDEILQAATNHGMNTFDDLVMASGNKAEIAKLKEDRANERAIATDARHEKMNARQVNRKRMADTEGNVDEEGNPTGVYSKSKPAVVKSNEMFDELPIGAWFIAKGMDAPRMKTKERNAAPSGE